MALCFCYSVQGIRFGVGIVIFKYSLQLFEKRNQIPVVSSSSLVSYYPVQTWEEVYSVTNKNYPISGPSPQD